MTNALDRLRAALADRYTIERELGSGGMATVYLAEDLKHRRQVAIKVMRPELAASLGAGRFLREIQISARLNHPNILTLIDSGEVEGMLYYVMPYLEGESLRDRMNREGQEAKSVSHGGPTMYINDKAEKMNVSTESKNLSWNVIRSISAQTPFGRNAALSIYRGVQSYVG